MRARTMNAINIDVFARQLIADRCSALIESHGMLPENILAIVKHARDEYFREPTNKNYEYIKKLFSQTKYIEDAVEYKDFNRRLLLIAFKFAINKSKNYFVNYKSILEVALKRLDGINPDMKSSPRALLQHYNECLESLDNPRNDQHHLITFAKEIITKMFVETIDLYSYNNKSPFESSIGGVGVNNVTNLSATVQSNNKSRKMDTTTAPPLNNEASYKIATPLFTL
ncbi:AC106-like protein [Orgyia pseudotsugata single capsid nuclopolyhedrovirus]|nr:AC106-like protein [Orgyia pseudotsugata single capsid nuclopolyhedrovirus]